MSAWDVTEVIFEQDLKERRKELVGYLGVRVVVVVMGEG